MIHVTGTLAFDTVGVVAHLPGANATARVGALARLPGGAAGNVAAALARLGSRAAVVSAVGPDFEDSGYERSLLDVGVDLSHVSRVKAPTAEAFVFGEEEGNQITFFHPGASRELAKAPVPRAEIGHFSAGEISDYPRRMQACGIVSFDPGQEVFHRDLAEIRACFPHADYLFVNRYELNRLKDAFGWEVGDFLREGLRAVIESRGAEGCVLHAGAGKRQVPAAPPAHVADATGAGDAHRAGFLLALHHGAAPEEALRVGAVVASFAVEGVGPQASLPTLSEALDRYRKTFGDPPAGLRYL